MIYKSFKSINPLKRTDVYKTIRKEGILENILRNLENLDTSLIKESLYFILGAGKITPANEPVIYNRLNDFSNQKLNEPLPVYVSQEN